MTTLPFDHPSTATPTTEWVHVTPELAGEWLSANHDNRNKRGAHIRNLARDIRDGNWKTTGDSIKFDWNGRLIDGQHRLEAVILAAAPIGVLVIRGLEPQAREVIDTNAKRSGADALRFRGAEMDPILLAAVARLALSREAGLVTNALSQTSQSKTNTEITQWAVDNPDAIHACALARRTAKPIGIQPSAWAYCLLEFIRVDPERGVEFATSTAEFRTSGKGDPRHTLIDVFRRAQMGQRRKPTQAESIYISFRAWNAWIRGTTLSQVIAIRDGEGNEIPALLSPKR